eukprot:CAMPEP_0178930066 /NCGR_PEP_ID=MMETSP0786-20121207/21004_1 /TAXON_ID=186022 /ORGANISM="Thalassionema frauenfeldii, Strain CCMP 1798" /LENGTH=272 /DNA_ID=CAMNT_0020606503 /DNA_START=76 /DNA_END=891 /DNA_ORIENTATION=-
MPDLYDLEIVDQAFGPDADLYMDVLRVSYFSSDDEIQSAFFDRRSEIFGILSKLTDSQDEVSMSQRRLAERRMDAIVMTFRILKDPALRAIYEGERERRIANRPDLIRKSSGHNTPSMRSPRAVYAFDESVSASYDERSKRLERKLMNHSKQESSLSPRSVEISVNQSDSNISPEKSVSASVLSEGETEFSVEETATSISFQEGDTEGELSMYEDDGYVSANEETPPRPKGILGRIRQSKMVRSIVEECNGACMDTTMAFDQVCNAFTLQER